MPTIIHKIGDDFEADSGDLKDFMLWLCIPVIAALLFFLGTLHSNSWMIIASISLLAVIGVIDVCYSLYSLLSFWWDNMGRDEAGKDAR